MSQQKVDKYKQDKANRSQLIKKQKRNFRIEIIAITAVVVGLLGWFGVSYYERLETAKPPTEYPISSGAIDDYLSDLDAPANEANEADEATEEEE